MGNYLYVCDTLYHVYVATLKSYTISGHHEILLKDTIPNYRAIITNLRKSNNFNNVRLIKEKFLIEKKNRLALFNLKKYFDPIDDNSVDKKLEIILFLDTTYFAKFLLKYYDDCNFTLVEDGELAYVRKRETIKDQLKKIFNLPIGFGRDLPIKVIEVQNPERLESSKRLKARVLPLKRMENSLSKKELFEIFEIFDFSPVDYSFEGSSILLTQPLSEDGLISEQGKIRLYQDIINKYLKNKRLVIKVHPRETTNYAYHFPEVNIIAGSFPVELLNHKLVRFDIGVTLFSSALNNLQNVENVIFLGLDYSHEVRLAYSKKHGLLL